MGQWRKMHRRIQDRAELLLGPHTLLRCSCRRNATLRSHHFTYAGPDVVKDGAFGKQAAPRGGGATDKTQEAPSLESLDLAPIKDGQSQPDTGKFWARAKAVSGLP